MDKSFRATYFDFSQLNRSDFIHAIKDTLFMTGISMIFVIIFGILLGLALYSLSKSQRKGSRLLYQIVAVISNIFRSTPFIILIVLLLPFTKILVGSILGAKAAIPALVLSAVPFYARLVEMAFREVDQGVLEAAEAMGATPFQMIWKVLLPESSPALISGATVSAITMIGFTAMAGAIGAGGLGGLAYQDGFQRNRLTVTLFATVLLLLIVFLVQGLGDLAVNYADKRLQKSSTKQRFTAKSKFITALIAVCLLVVGFFGFAPKDTDTAKKGSTQTVLKVGASSTPHAEILQHIKPLLAKKGVQLEIITFEDYVLPNQALERKEIDANYFQSLPYFKKEIAEKGYDFVNIGNIHAEPMALYSKKWKSLKDLPNGATVIASNSESDWGRIIGILQAASLVKIKSDVNIQNATFDDIVENPKQLKFEHSLDPAMLTTAYQNQEGDVIAINANYAVSVGLNPHKDSLAVQKDLTAYANIIAVRKEDQNRPALKKLVEVLHQKDVQAWMSQKYKGVVEPLDK